jgi:hypothetical protein
VAELAAVEMITLAPLWRCCLAYRSREWNGVFKTGLLIGFIFGRWQKTMPRRRSGQLTQAQIVREAMDHESPDRIRSPSEP